MPGKPGERGPARCGDTQAVCLSGRIMGRMGFSLSLKEQYPEGGGGGLMAKAGLLLWGQTWFVSPAALDYLVPGSEPWQTAGDEEG